MRAGRLLEGSRRLGLAGERRRGEEEKEKRKDKT